MKNLLFTLLVLLLSSEEKIKIGESYCTVKVTENPDAVATIISLHDKENTAIEAYKMLPKDYRYNLLELNHNEKERNVFFDYKGDNYSFDPNRIFTEDGIVSTLIKSNKGKKITNNIRIEVNEFSKKILDIIKETRKGKYLLAAHNNNDGYKGEGSVSILNYANKNHIDSQDIKEVYISKSGMDKDDFVLVTQESDFDFFKSKDVNVAVYNDAPRINDGSMSYYCITKNIPYINIEAEHGHVKEQVKLMKMTYELLKMR